MSPIPFQVVLLFAVATSQIFGGISCCCLGRTLFAELDTADNVTATKLASQHKFSSAPPKRQTGRCPKCSVRKSSSTASGGGSEQASSGRLKNRRAKVCEDGQCLCIKHVVDACPPSSPPSLSHESYAWVSPVLNVKPDREVLACILDKHEVPVRFGGRSWQSIACLWKN